MFEMPECTRNEHNEEYVYEALGGTRNVLEIKVEACIYTLSFLIDVTNCSTKGAMGLVLFTVSGHRPSWQGSDRSRSSEEAAGQIASTVRKQRKRNACSQVLEAPKGWGFLTHLTYLIRIPYRHAQRHTSMIILNTMILTKSNPFSINYYSCYIWAKIFFLICLILKLLVSLNSNRMLN